MMAAEKWHEYQKCYKRYGLDMKPVVEEKKVRKASGPFISAKDKARFMLLVLVFGALCISLIVMAAYSTQIKFETNSLIAKSSVVQGEIENLNVAIKSANNISVVEERAIAELGMVYPQIDQIAFIEASSSAGDEHTGEPSRIAYKK